MGDLLFTVALVTVMQAGNPVAMATGFFYAKSDVVYFVTNRHVVIDEARGTRPDILRVRLHTDPKDLTKNVNRDIPLYSSGAPRWHAHPKYPNPAIDVVVIELDPDRILSDVFIKTVDSLDFFPKRFVMAPGEDVMVLGYPRGFSDAIHNLPLVRNALVSSAYGVGFNGMPVFLIDANLHHGMSGSPVLTKPKNIWLGRDGGTNMLGGSPVYFLGVFSATISKNVSPTKQEPLGLGQVWYGQLIEEIIASIEEA